LLIFSDGEVSNSSSNPIINKGWENNSIFGWGGGEGPYQASARPSGASIPKAVDTFESTYATSGEKFESVAAIERCFYGVHMGHSSNICASPDESRASYFHRDWYKSAVGQQSFINCHDKIKAADVMCSPCGVNIMEGASLYQEDIQRGSRIPMSEGFLLETLYYGLMTQHPHPGLEFWRPLPLEFINGVNQRPVDNQAVRVPLFNRARSE
jgi:hypothetical protein